MNPNAPMGNTQGSVGNWNISDVMPAIGLQALGAGISIYQQERQAKHNKELAAYQASATER